MAKNESDVTEELLDKKLLDLKEELKDDIDTKLLDLKEELKVIIIDLLEKNKNKSG